MENIKKYRVKGLAFLLLALLGYSCVSTRSLLIEIPKPAPEDLPGSIQSLTLASQAVNEKFNDLPADSLQKIFFEKRFNYDTVIYDLQMADTTLQALGDLLFESGRYDYVIPRNRFLNGSESSVFAQPLPWETVRELTREFNTDALLSLEHLSARVITDFGNESYYDPFQDGFYSAARAQMKIRYEALFRVYDPEQEKIVLSKFLRDTLYWEDADVSTRNLFSRFTPVKKALAEAGIAIALDLSEKISVIWRTERRTYFSGREEKMKNAGQFAQNGNWQAALNLWKETAENTNSKSKKSKAQFNVAVACEMTGNLDEAIDWALKSYNTMYRPLTYEYLQVLKRRKNEMKRAG